MLDFPGPGGLTVGQIFTSAGKSWQWDGAKWAAAAGGGAPLDSPSFTGDPKAPTPATADNDTSIATTAFVKAQGYLINNQLITLSGDIAGSGATAITTTLATVNSNVGTFQGLTVNAKGQITAASNQNYAPLASPVFTGDPKAPTPATADNDTSIATTAFVKAQNYVTGGPYLPTAGGSLTGDLIAGSASGSQIQVSGPAGIDGVMYFSVGGANVWTLGAKSGASLGQFWLYDASNGKLAMQVSGTDTAFRNTNHYFYDATASIAFALFKAAGTYNQSGAWISLSDAALKENVAPYERGLEAILALNPVSFTYVATSPFGDDGGTPRFGLIAQEAEAVVPEIVSELETKSGTIKATEGSNLVYALINAVKELTARLEALEAR